MKQVTGNIMNYIGRCPAICVTTNGFVKKDGTAVMGKGIAKQMSEKFKDLPRLLGDHIKRNGNSVGVLMNVSGTDIISFPVKPRNITIYSKEDMNSIVSFKQKDFKVGADVPGFWAKADLEVIRKSCGELNGLKRSNGYKYVLMPLPGCGAGELSYVQNIKPLVEEKFGHDDGIFLMSFKQQDFSK